MNMKKRTVAENLFYNIIYQVIGTLLPIITTPYTARVLGLHANGIHAFTESIVTYFIIFGSLGTSLYGIRKVAYVRDDMGELAKTTWEIIVLKAMLVGLTLAVYIPALCINSEYAYIYRIQIINIVASGLDISWFYQGVEDFKRVTIRNLFVKLLFVVSLFTLVRSPDDLGKYVFLIVTSAFLGNLLMIYYLPQYIDRRIEGRIRPFVHLKGSVQLFVPQVMNYVYALLDRSMLGWMTNTDNVSIYDNAQRIIRIVTALLQSLGYVMMARVANLTASEDKEGIKYYIHKSLNFTLFMAFPAMLGLMGIVNEFVPVFFGEEFMEVAPTLKMLSLLILTMSLNSILGVQMLLPMGKEKIYTLSTGSAAIVNILVNVVLIPIIGLKGACISSLAAEAVSFFISYFHLRESFDVRKIVRDNRMVVISSIIMYIVVRGVASYVDANVFVMLLAEVIIGGTVYMTLMLLTKNEILYLIIEKVRNVLVAVKNRNIN